MGSLPNSIFAFGVPLPSVGHEPAPAFPTHVAIHQFIGEIAHFEPLNAWRNLSHAFEQAAPIVQADVAVRMQPPFTESSASDEMQWLVSHSADLEQFAGEWLLLSGGILLGHSKRFGDLKALIAQREIASPFVYYVPTSEESNSVSI